MVQIGTNPGNAIWRGASDKQLEVLASEGIPSEDEELIQFAEKNLKRLKAMEIPLELLPEFRQFSGHYFKEHGVDTPYMDAVNAFKKAHGLKVDPSYQ